MSRRGRRNWSNLEINKRICKHLIMHRIWNNLSQTNLSKDIGTTFQQYQKVEKCENRCMAEQLLEVCNAYDWDPRTILKADPVQTLDAWIHRRKPRTRANIVNRPERIRQKLDKLNDQAYKHYFKKNSTDPLILTEDMEVK